MDYLPVEVLDCFFLLTVIVFVCLVILVFFWYWFVYPAFSFVSILYAARVISFWVFIDFDLRFVRGVLWMLECQSRYKVFINFFFFLHFHVFISIILLNFFFNVIFCFSRASEDRVELGRLAAVILQCHSVRCVWRQLPIGVWWLLWCEFRWVFG